MLNTTKKRSAAIAATVMAAVFLLAYIFCLPADLFKNSKYSTVVTDRAGNLIGARIAEDGQWRFPPCDSVPERYAAALIQFEDRCFRYHPGVNPVSILKAARGNMKAGRVTGGGSTLTMQVIRLSRGKERTIWQKIIEATLATRLELRYPKDKILALYASHAPFGGNVVGLEAASWRYFGRPPEDLSWGEAATLAVLPNSPSGAHPGKNREQLLAKRNRLLQRLEARGLIDSLTCALGCEEDLPPAPLPLPQIAPQLTDYYASNFPGERVRSSIDIHLQTQVDALVSVLNGEYSRIGVKDLAAVVIDVHSGDILAYIGNANPNDKRPGAMVDIPRAPRSTGSILKPFLYCALLQSGQMLPQSLVPDIPVNINGFSPQNFDMQFCGACPADKALSRSLNVPAVFMLRTYGVPLFYMLLKDCGMSTLTRSSSDYGLSLILGGAEGSLLDITSMYASLSREYQSTDKTGFPLNDKAALWHTIEALKEVNRPDEIDWKTLTSVRKAAWKTGTSYGFRDAWAVGVTPDYAVGVWAGNAQGQGVPNLTGARFAGPVMFDILNLLPEKATVGPYAEGGWFLEPGPDSYIRAEVCRRSGFLKGIACPDADTVMLPKAAMRSETCPYHSISEGESVFRLPPSMEWFYRQGHPEYDATAGKKNDFGDAPMGFIYPEGGSIIYLPRQLDGTVKGAVFNLAHRNTSSIVWWHLDNEYIGQTQFIHQMTLAPEEGKHTVTVVDEEGNSLSVGFRVASGGESKQ